MHVFNENTLNCAPLPKVFMTRLKKVLNQYILKLWTSSLHRIGSHTVARLIQKLKKSKWQITGFQDAYNIVCMNGKFRERNEWQILNSNGQILTFAIQL